MSTKNPGKSQFALCETADTDSNHAEQLQCRRKTPEKVNLLFVKLQIRAVTTLSSSKVDEKNRPSMRGQAVKEE